MSRRSSLESGAGRYVYLVLNPFMIMMTEVFGKRQRGHGGEPVVQLHRVNRPTGHITRPV